MMNPRTIRIILWAAIALFLLGFAYLAKGETPKERVAHVRQLVARQRAALSQKLGWTWNELQTAQTQINQVATERDGWHAYGDDRNEKWLNAEVRVAKEQKRILQLYIILGGIVLALGVYAYLHYGYHIIP